ncbi:MAG: 3-phosphoshikimate 1-carboxyvinyltransferase [Bacteroidales bacterium]|nr:3-phosphoshikimate 1-carboxyvinyltransferase [Bacteroidales bacterium]
MKQVVVPSKIFGKIKAPASKSVTQRAIAAALLAEGESTIVNPSYCDDALAAMSIASGLGAKVRPNPGELKIIGTTGLKEQKLNCGESGLAIRMFSPIASLFSDEIKLTGSGTLKARPMSMIQDALTQFGVKCESNNGLLPITIQGPLKGGKCTIDGSLSSQILTGLMMALPMAEEDSEIEVISLRSKPYIDMTLKVINDFGVTINRVGYNYFKIQGGQHFKAQTYTVESDWSGSAFLLVAGAIMGKVIITDLNPVSQQGDKAIITALDKAGASLNISNNSIEVSKNRLKAFEFDAVDTPDLFPPLVALASYCKGTSAIKGVKRLINKESDRCQALLEEFTKLGVKVEIVDDYMLVSGATIKGGDVVSHDDHRIAMALAVAALGAEDKVNIKDAHCVSKSYPNFFDDLRSICTDL